MSDFFDKVKGFFSGDTEEIVDEAGDVVGEAGNVAEDVVIDVIKTQSKLDEYKEIISIFVIVLLFTCPITYTVVGGVLTKFTKLIKVPIEFGASALTERSWKLWIIHSVVIAVVIAGLKYKKLI
tara:strand:- start:1154 stop:1525 length:372 start_codon:yes stop_codon:yes gene_type:complete